jgi:hypothetical protein
LVKETLWEERKRKENEEEKIGHLIGISPELM